MPGNNSSFLFLILLILPFGMIFYIFKKNKKNSSTKNITHQKRRADDEVWKVIKDFLKKNGCVGKEIYESFVAKRPDINEIDRNLPRDQRKAKALELKNKRKIEKQKAKELKKKGGKLKREMPKELYVATFITKDPKTGIIDQPRAIECMVVTELVEKKQQSRKIIVTQELDFEKEMIWIKPIKDKEEALYRKKIDKEKKHQERLAKIKKIWKRKQKPQIVEK